VVHGALIIECNPIMRIKTVLLNAYIAPHPELMVNNFKVKSSRRDYFLNQFEMLDYI
jgi:hypothetical protein